MNTGKFLFTTLIAVASLSVTSCEKKDESSPEITLLEPSEGDTISLSTDSVHIEFHIMDNDEIHMAKVDVAQSGVNIFSNSNDVDAPMYHFHQHMKPQNISAVTPLELTITASDHSGNQSSKKATFYVKP